MMQRIGNLVQHTAIYGMGDLLGRAVSVLLVPIYARHLTPTDNGVLSLAFAFIGFSAVFYSLGLNPALIRLLSGKTDLSQYRPDFSSAFWTLFFLGLFFSSLLWLNASTLSHHLLGDIQHTTFIQIIAIVIVLDTLSEPFFTLCRAQKRSLYYAIVRVIQHSLQLGLTIYLITEQNHGPIAVFEANIISSIFALIVMLPAGITLLRPTLSIQSLKQLLSFGLPFVPSTLSLLVINLSDRFLIRYFLGLDDLGIYGITYKLGLPIFFVVKAFRAAWAPAVLDETKREETRQMCARVTTYFALLGIFGCLILATFAHEIVVLIAGDNADTYLKGIRVAPLIGLSFFFYGLYVILTAGIYAEGRANSLPIIVGIGAGVNLAINIFLLPQIGFIAAAYSTLAAYFIMVILLYLSVRKFYPIAYEYVRLGKICVTGIIVFIALSAYLHDTSTEGVIARLIFVLSYPLILWGWQFFNPRELQNLRHMFR